MKQTARILSTYTADVSGVCSALFELGGMVVMHDPSGCNSTYNTHDEPRWYDYDSLIFISGLKEIDAVFGNDDKLIEDIETAAVELHPAFIALVRTPIPMLNGTDFEAIARILEKRLSIPVFALPTNGTFSYIKGISWALEALCERYMVPLEKKARGVNLLGVTPLDFSINETLDSIHDFLSVHEWECVSCMAMGSSLTDIEKAPQAKVNLVVSAAGLGVARKMKERFGIPYVTGIPVDGFSDVLAKAMETAAKTGENQCVTNLRCMDSKQKKITIIGEAVSAGSLASAFALEGYPAQVLCPLEEEAEVMAAGDFCYSSEEEIEAVLSNCEAVIADPMYRCLCSSETAFYTLPHEAFSGRIYRKLIPDLCNLSIREIMFRLFS